MIYGAIDEKSEKYYTDLKKVFDAISNKQLEYNWLITYCECYPVDPETDSLLNKDYCWITGEELTELVSKERFQWVWAVLSGFDKDITLSDVLKYSFPYADGYKGFWQKPLSIQHPLAHIEIVPWDSSLTLLFCDDKSVVDCFLNAFPYSENLENYLDKE